MDAANLSSTFMGVSLVGTAISSIGQIMQGQAQKEAYEYNAKMARIEAGLKESQIRKKYRTLMGEQKALYAEAGVDITSGSPLFVVAMQAAEGEEEALMARYTGQAEADKYKYYGKQARQAGYTGAISTFVTGLGKVGTDYALSKKK